MFLTIFQIFVNGNNNYYLIHISRADETKIIRWAHWPLPILYWKGIYFVNNRSNTGNIIRLRLCSFSSYYCCRWIQSDLLSKHRMTSSWLRRSLAFILFGMLFHMSTRLRLTFLSTYTYHTRPRLPQPDFRFFFLLLSTELCVNKRNKTKSIPLALRNIVGIPTTFTQTHGQDVLSYVTLLCLII